MSEKVYYYVEQKPGKNYENSYIRSICENCKGKLFPDNKMMVYNGPFGDFVVKCYACEKTLHGEQWQK